MRNVRLDRDRPDRGLRAVGGVRAVGRVRTVIGGDRPSTEVTARAARLQRETLKALRNPPCGFRLSGRLPLGKLDHRKCSMNAARRRYAEN